MFSVYRLSEINIDSKIGEQVCVKGLVKSVTYKNAKNGSEYAIVDIGDQKVSVGAKMWGVNDSVKESLKTGKVCEFNMSVESYAGKASCIIKRFDILDESPIDYVERVEHADEYKRIILQAMSKMDHDRVYYQVMREIFTNDILERVMVHPAASANHHNMVGGLAMHTATMLQAGYQLAQVYGLDIDLVLAGILVHDLEKLQELEIIPETGEIKYSARGGLLGHIVMGAIEIDRAADRLGLVDSEEVVLLKHVVLSHHGLREWGSPVVPAIPEALLVHTVDRLDAEMFKMNRLIEKTEPGSTLFEKGLVVYRPEAKIDMSEIHDEDDSEDYGDDSDKYEDS